MQFAPYPFQIWISFSIKKKSPPSIYLPFCIFQRINKSWSLCFSLPPGVRGRYYSVLEMWKLRLSETLLAKANKDNTYWINNAFIIWYWFLTKWGFSNGKFANKTCSHGKNIKYKGLYSRDQERTRFRNRRIPPSALEPFHFPHGVT